MQNSIIPFNKPYMTGKELYNIVDAHHSLHLAGDGKYTNSCTEWLEKNTGAPKAILTHSCTAALEMASILLNIEAGDEIIMPSFTFVSTANAFVMRGGKPVFVDIRPDTLNIDEKLIEQAITPRTKAIVPVHYAGVGCQMDIITEIASKHNLEIVEDAAQALMAEFKGRALGTWGRYGTLSFHETKNIISGEGGALILNNTADVERGEIIRDKGTNRKKFFEGNVDKYTWIDKGSSYLPGEIIAAFLWAQLKEAKEIQARRNAIWQFYNQNLKPLENAELLRRPVIPADCTHNAHLYYILLNTRYARDKFLNKLKERGIHAVFHYIPLHSSPAGLKYCSTATPMPITDHVASSLVRLPLYNEMEEEEAVRVIEALQDILESGQCEKTN